MTADETIAHGKYFLSKLRSIERLAKGDTLSEHPVVGLRTQILDFLRVTVGPRSSFAQQVERLDETVDWHQAARLAAIMESFIDQIQRGLGGAISVERKAQLDVVSDLLGQAQQLLEDKTVHPAAPAVLIGATLEEFLRGWVESAGLSLGNRKPGLQNYGTVLAEAELITKQDVKDLTAWGGLRNHAAHGEWTEVQDPNRIKVMLEGINLFMRKYGQA